MKERSGDGKRIDKAKNEEFTRRSGFLSALPRFLREAVVCVRPPLSDIFSCDLSALDVGTHTSTYVYLRRHPQAEQRAKKLAELEARRASGQGDRDRSPDEVSLQCDSVRASLRTGKYKLCTLQSLRRGFYLANAVRSTFCARATVVSK